MQVTKTGNTFPADGVEQIREAVLDYLSTNSTFGEDIIYTRLFTPINTVPGHQVDLLEIGKTPLTLGTSNITIDWNEFPISLAEYIEVTVTT